MEAAVTAGGRDGAGAERRSAPRTRVFEEHGIVSVRIRPGREASIIDVSAGGILIETLHRLLPGTSIELQVAGAGARTAMRGRVLRSSVACLRGGRVLYRGALMFDRPFALGLDGSVHQGRSVPPRHDREDATPPIL